MKIVDNSTTVQIKEILAQATITSTSPLPPTHMGKGMLDGHPLTQFGPSLWGLLTLA